MRDYYLCNSHTAKQRIDNREVSIAVIGQGKMGLPISTVFVQQGYVVYGVDNNLEVVKSINAGDIPIVNEPYVKETLNMALNQIYFCLADFKGIIDSIDIYIVIIPLLIDENNHCKIENMTNFIRNLGKNIKKGQMVIIETTLPPTTTENILKPILEEESGLEVGKDIGLVFSPERTRSNRVLSDIVHNYKKIIGGSTERCTERAKFLYDSIAMKGTICMTSPTAAECVKVFRGVYRDVNIALAGEFQRYTDKIGVDLVEITEVSNTTPSTKIPHSASGVGGHCIPVYPHFFIDEAKKVGVEAHITALARKRNKDMSRYIVEKIVQWLNERGKCVATSVITILGLSYRANVKEHCNSPTIDIMKILSKEYHAKQILHDPLYTDEEAREIIDIPAMAFEDDFNKAINGVDLVVVLPRHDQYRYLIDLIPNSLDITKALEGYYSF